MIQIRKRADWFNTSTHTSQVDTLSLTVHIITVYGFVGEFQFWRVNFSKYWIIWALECVLDKWDIGISCSCSILTIPGMQFKNFRSKTNWSFFSTIIFSVTKLIQFCMYWRALLTEIHVITTDIVKHATCTMGQLTSWCNVVQFILSCQTISDTVFQPRHRNR